MNSQAQRASVNQEWRPTAPSGPVRVASLAGHPSSERGQGLRSPIDQWPPRQPGGKLVRKFQVQHQIQDATSLPVGWDGYSAEPPSRIAIEGTLRALDVLYELGSVPVSAVALADGGLALILMARPFYAAVELYNDGEVVVAFSDRKERQQAWEVGAGKAELNTAIERLHDLMHD